MPSTAKIRFCPLYRPKADIPDDDPYVRFVPKADISDGKINSVPALTSDFRVLVQNHIQQRTMHFYAAVVVNKA
jgi:hypothetical protein